MFYVSAYPCVSTPVPLTCVWAFGFVGCILLLSLPPCPRALAPCCLRFLLPSLWLLLFALIMSCPWLIVMSSLTRSPLPSAGSVDIYIYINKYIYICRYWIDSISIRPPLVSLPFQFEIRWFASPRPRSRSEFGKNARKVELLPRLGVDLQLVLQMFLEEFWTSLIGRFQLRISIQQVELS